MAQQARFASLPLREDIFHFHKLVVRTLSFLKEEPTPYLHVRRLELFFF